MEADCNERVAAAEHAMALLKKNIVDVCEENRQLRAQVEDLKEEKRVKKVRLCIFVRCLPTLLSGPI